MESLAAAEAYTKELAHSHYENFSVISVLLPRRLRQDFCNVYAFCRVADDLGDEVVTQRLDFSGGFSRGNRRCYAGKATDGGVCRPEGDDGAARYSDRPFLDLIGAFEQDQTVTRYDEFEQVVDYCRRSADPVGRLVLYMCGYRDEERQQLSDTTCTALQLTNFWQDVRRDIFERDRIYLPPTPWPGLA